MKWEKWILDKRHTPWILIIGWIIIVSLSCGLKAKYVHGYKEVKGTEAKNFYFTSDTLSEKGENYTLSPDTTALTIEVRNYEDELRWADTDISYEYEVSKKEIVEQKGTGEIKRDEQNGTGKIKRDEQKGSKSEIKIDGLTEGTYEIKVSSTDPFEKTLTGIYKISKADEAIKTTISDTSGSPYVLVDVAVQNYKGNIIIKWPSGLIPDATESAMESTKNYENNSYLEGSQKISVDAYSTYAYRFFKEDMTKDFSTSDQICVSKVTD